MGKSSKDYHLSHPDRHDNLRVIMIKYRLLSPLILLFAVPLTFGAAEPLSCADRSIVAGAVRTTKDAERFVQCAYEFAQEVGFENARQAFNDDERWKSGAIYVFVAEVSPLSDMSRALVFPPDPSREGLPWGLLIDAFGNDWFREQHRIMTSIGEGWIYYSFTNPATGRDEPKASYLKRIDWDGIPSSIGAGIYRRDLPGTCWSEEVNAPGLEENPSNQKLQELVRCAALELASKGYFATITLSVDPRWRSNSIYLFGLDTSGSPLFSGDRYSWWFGPSDSELDAALNASLQGQDVISVADAFGESFLYYSTRNPATGLLQRKVTFVKRVVAYGLPLLVGSGYYLEDDAVVSRRDEIP